MKKVLLGIIIGVVFSGVTVFASSLLSKDIFFTPTNENWEVTNVEEALNYLYENTGVEIDSENVLELLADGYNYTFTEDYDVVFSMYGTREWAKTNYTVSGLSTPVYRSRIGKDTFGVEILIYRDVKAGSSVNLGGTAERGLKVFAIK